ncbi:MAG TPA: hypothetical protein VMD59_21870 [Acidimicrobiales bacterium]|nr:hypothetical protein [Acidimicrobiales bacterium]
MDQSNVEAAEAAAAEATPIFAAYRRGYDPVQVDRYVADQQRRLDDATTRASEAERKLAAAVGQLRELHRRVAVLESEDRQPRPAPLDELGERVQRILQEAWEGAYALRQQAEAEAASLREEVAGEAASTVAEAEQHAGGIVEAAERRAAAIDAEIERRRIAWNARLEEDRAQAVAQIRFLHTQRNDAVAELLRLRAMIEKAVQDLGSVTAAPGTGAGAGGGDAMEWPAPGSLDTSAARADLDEASAAEAAAMAALAGLARAGTPGPREVEPGAPFDPLTGSSSAGSTNAATAPGVGAAVGAGAGAGGSPAGERGAGARTRPGPPPAASNEPAVRLQRPRPRAHQTHGDRHTHQPLDDTTAVPAVTPPGTNLAGQPATGPAGVFDFEEEQPS